MCTFLNPVMYNVCEVCNHEFNWFRGFL
jgi:hypothetical protein